MNIRKVLEYALQREYEGKAFFEKNADRLSNAAASGAFKIIAKEEQRHIEYIQAHLDALDTNKPVEQAASKAEGEAKDTLEMLARWEAGHERLFKRMHDEAFEKYTEMPWGG